MAEPLSAADRSSLASEVNNINMAVGGLLIFEAGSGIDRTSIIRRIEERVHLIPRYSQRLEEPIGRVTNPVWIEDKDFDVGWHVRQVSLRPPGGPVELAAVVAHEMSHRLDRSAPLWEMTVVQGLAGGRTALIPKMHHALVDGAAAVDIGTVLLDPSPTPLDLPPAEVKESADWDRRRHLARMPWEIASQTSERVVRQSLRQAERLRNPITAPLRAVGDVRKATDLLTELARQRPSAPPTPLNVTLGRTRGYALRRADLAQLKAAAKTCGGTINDGILAIVAGALQRYFAIAGATVDRDPVALVPVSVRREGEEGGNRISTVLVDLPGGVTDPAQRIAQINATMTRIKDSAAVRAGALMVQAGGLAPPFVSSTLARAMTGARPFNLVVSNVPGPQMPFYLLGLRMEEVYPAVPLNPSSQGLNVGVLSYDGGVHFGLSSTGSLEPGVETAADALSAAAEELLALG